MASRFGDLLLDAAVVACWWIRFGPLGPSFGADTAVIGAMALRPFTREGLYFWGQDRLGALDPLLARWPIHAFGSDAAATAQVIAYAGAALMAWALIRLLRTWEWKLALACVLAFPSMDLAWWMVDPSQPGPIGGLLAALQLLAFLRALERPTRRTVATAAFLAGLTLWAAENCLLLLPSEMAVTWVHVHRASKARSPALRPLVLAALAGLIPPLALVALGKHFSYRVADSYFLRHLDEGLRTFLGLRGQLTALAPLLRTTLYPISIALAVGATVALWRWARSARERPPTWAMLGWAPLLCFLVTSEADWFRANYYSPRYLAFGVLLAVVASCLFLETLSLRGQPVTVRTLGTLGAVALGLGSVAAAIPSAFARAPSGSHWRAKTVLALEAGCRGLVADYWESYPYLTLSQGVILATPHEKAYVRSKPLADDAVRQSAVCVVPWDAPLDQCPPELTQFGALLTLRDRFEGKADEERVVYCRYRSSLAP
jgi:hypothetical protein